MKYLVELCTKETPPVHQLLLFPLIRIKRGAQLIFRWLSISKSFMECELNEAQRQYVWMGTNVIYVRYGHVRVFFLVIILYSTTIYIACTSNYILYIN